MAGGDLCRTSLPIGEGLVHAWLVGWWIHSHRGREVLWELGISLEKSRASRPTGCLSSLIAVVCLPRGPTCWH